MISIAEPLLDNDIYHGNGFFYNMTYGSWGGLWNFNFCSWFNFKKR